MQKSYCATFLTHAEVVLCYIPDSNYVTKPLPEMLIVSLPKGKTDLTKGEASKAGFEVKMFGRRS